MQIISILLLFATLGDAQDFGDSDPKILLVDLPVQMAHEEFLHLGNDGANRNYIDYVTMTSTGNAMDFGDLTLAEDIVQQLDALQPVVFIGGGYANPEGSTTNTNVDYVEFATQGNAVDFGDLTQERRHVSCL